MIRSGEHAYFEAMVQRDGVRAIVRGAFEEAAWFEELVACARRVADRGRFPSSTSVRRRYGR